VRSPARSVANSEFHHTSDEVNDVARRITTALERARIRASAGKILLKKHLTILPH
jgi:hypothetical protein